MGDDSESLRMRVAALEAENERLRARLKREKSTSMNNLAQLISGDSSPFPTSPRSPMIAAMAQEAIPEDPKSDWKALTIVVLGATGDLAKKKTFPALMALSRAGLLPPHSSIVGYGRTKWSQEEFEKMLDGSLKHCNEKEAFKRRCVYQAGNYDSPEDMQALCDVCEVCVPTRDISNILACLKHAIVSMQNRAGDPREVKLCCRGCDSCTRCHTQDSPTPEPPVFDRLEKATIPVSPERDTCNGVACANRLFYFAIPPFAYPGAAKAIHLSAMSKTGWSRMVIEKPFGRDSESYLELASALAAEFSENQMFRIDHYLGKEIAQNIMTLRFANLVFEPLWNRTHVNCVHISFKEDIGTQGRGGYFNEYGMIRDVMQNHLLQLLALVAMETPISLGADDIRNRKVEVLRCIEPIKMDEVVVGQYTANPMLGQVGYLDDRTVPPDSIAPTYAVAAVYVNNARWSGVPFILSCGKALDEKLVDIRVQFKPISGNLFSDKKNVYPNELVMRVQPDEAIFLRCMTKYPGLSAEVAHVEMDLTYKKHFQEGMDLPDAYERLILDALQGDSSLFVRDDELAAAWRIFTPVLQELEQKRVKPLPYEFGTNGPKAAAALVRKLGFRDFSKLELEEGKLQVKQMESFTLSERE